MTLKDFLNNYAELLGDAFVMFMGAWFLFAFVMILTTGSFVGIEPRTWIARIELVVSFLILLLGFDRFILDVKSIRAAKA